MRPPITVMDSPRTSDLKEMRRKRLEYFCRSQPPDTNDSPTKVETKIAVNTSTKVDEDHDTHLASSEYSRMTSESSELEREERENQIWTIRPEKQREPISQCPIVASKNVQDLPRERTLSPEDLETLSQPCLDYEDETSDVAADGIDPSRRASPRSFTNVSKMWDSIMLKHLGESSDDTERLSDAGSEISGTSDYTLAASTNVTDKISLASTHTIVKDTPLTKPQPKIETIEVESELKLPHLLETMSEPQEKSSLVRDILTSPQNDITTAMVKLGISDNSYIEGYLKGLRHALGRQAFLEVVETSPELREIIDSMLMSQRSSVRKGPVSKSFAGPFSAISDKSSPRQSPNEYKDIDTRFVEPITDSWNRPGPSGDAKPKTVGSPAREPTNNERQRVVSASCAFSADEIYRRAKDLSLKESVNRKLDGTILEEGPRDLDNTRNRNTTVQYRDEPDSESSQLERSTADKRGDNSSVRTGISRDAQLWRDSDKKVEKPAVRPSERAQSQTSTNLPETSSLKRYFTSIERLNHGQSINYTEVSAQFEPLPEWATPRDGTIAVKDRVTKSTHSKTNPSNAMKDPVQIRPLPSTEPKKLKGANEQVLRPAQSQRVPIMHSTLPPSLSNLVQSSQDDLEGNFKAYQSYDNYMTQLRASWRDASVFKNEKSMDDFLENIASKSNNMNDFLGGLRTSFDVRQSRDYDVTEGPATRLRKSAESRGTESGTHVTGLTDKLNKIGVDWTLIRQDLITDQSKRSVGGASFRGPDGRSFVVTCPECGTNNRAYVTWCLDCGCVLIGVEPTETRKVTKVKVKDVRNKNDLELTNGATIDNAKIEITPRPDSTKPAKSRDFEAEVEIPGKSKQSAPSISGQSPRRRNKKISNPELAIHLSVSSSVDNTATSIEEPEIEVLPRLSTVSAVKSAVPIPSLDLSESSDYRSGRKSPDLISLASEDSDCDGEKTPKNESSLSDGEMMLGDESPPSLSNDPGKDPDDSPSLSDRTERVDASTFTDPPEQLFPTPKMATYLIHSPSMASQRPSTAGNNSNRQSLSNDRRPLSAEARTKKVATSMERRRAKPERPKWQTSSMDWYVKNKQRTNAWSPGQSATQDVRKSRNADTSQTAVVAFVPTPRDDTPRDERQAVAPPLVDGQTYSQRTWSPSKALCQNREGRFAPKRPFHWTLSKDRFAELITQSPRIMTGDVSFLLSLPDELVLHILTYLSHADLAHVGRTCRTLNRLAMDETLWRVIRVHGRGLTDQHLEEIGNRHPQSLDLTNCVGYDVTPSGVRTLFRNGVNLQCLTIAGCTGSSLTGDALVHAAAPRCPNLTDLSAAVTSIGNSTVTALSQAAETLMALNLCGNKDISDETVIKICQKHGRSLESLEIAECFNITSKAVKAIGQSCKGLLTLNMGQCYKITDQSVQQLAPSLSRLQRLDLRGCKQIKDSSVRELVRHCKRLESLTLANCQGCTDLAVVEIATYIHNIKYLDMGGCRLVTDVGIRSLAHNCLLLTYLDLSTTGVTHKSVSMLASYCSQRLEILKMNFCRDITELSLVKLARHCRKLREIHLYGCKTAKNADRILLENPNLSVKLLAM